MGILIPFPKLKVPANQRAKTARPLSSLDVRGDVRKGELVFFTGVRYERVDDTPKVPESNSRQTPNVVRRKRR